MDTSDSFDPTQRETDLQSTPETSDTIPDFIPRMINNLAPSDLEATIVFYKRMQNDPLAINLVNTIFQHLSSNQHSNQESSCSIYPVSSSNSEPITAAFNSYRDILSNPPGSHDSTLNANFMSSLRRDIQSNIASSSIPKDQPVSDPIYQHQPAIVALPFTSEIVKEGWLYKRGEYIQNWRPRYFILCRDGSFHGFKSDKPSCRLSTPLNNFTVRDCDIWVINRPKPYMFLIRGLRLTTNVDRLFSVNSEEERVSWVEAIRQIADSLKQSTALATSVNSVSASSLMDESKLGSTKDLTCNRRYQLADFELIRLIGRGTFGKVVLCKQRKSGRTYAMKILRKSVLIEKDEVKHTYTESRVLQMCQHPFMIQLKYALRSDDYFCFIMEYANGGELFEHLIREKHFSEPRAKFYISEIVLALGYLHSKSIIYRDLKLENLLLDSHGHIKIADFGLCKEDIGNGNTTRTFCGTPEYLAPEILRDEDYGLAVDWWSLGVVSYEMLCGALPFGGSTNPDDKERINTVLFNQILYKPVRVPNYLSRQAKNFVSGLLIKDPKNRLGGDANDAISLMNHPFLLGIDWNRLVKKEITPPWIPDVESESDSKYIPEEFLNQSITFTPPSSRRTSFCLEEPHFKRFSYHGSRQSLISFSSVLSQG